MFSEGLYYITNLDFMVSIPLLRAGLLSSLIPLLRGDKGVCSGNGKKTHPLPPLKRGFLKELNSPAPSQEGII